MPLVKEFSFLNSKCNNFPRGSNKFPNIIIMTKHYLIVFILGLLLAAPSLATTRILSSYASSTQRTDSVEAMCADIGSRDDIVNEETDSRKQSYDAAMDAAFTPTGVDLYLSATKDGDTITNVQSDYPTLLQEYIIFIVPFVIALLFVLFGLIPLCCCCACGCCCCKCCAKVDEPYTKVELCWPAIVLSAALGLILIISILGLAQAADIQNSVKATGCALSISMDDLLNGNVSSSGGFFIGMNGLSEQLTQVNDNLGDLDTQLGTIQTGGAQQTTTQSAYTAARTAVDQIPTGSGIANEVVPDIIYQEPLNDPAASTDLFSTFPGELGSSGTASTYLYITYEGLAVAQAQVDSITDSAQSFRTTITGGTISDSITEAKDLVADFADKIEGYDTQLYNGYSSTFPIVETITKAMLGFYSGLVALSALAIIAVILTVGCSRYKCRYLFYFVCVVLTVVGLLCLVLAVLFSALVPPIYMACGFLETTFESREGFESTIGKDMGADTKQFFTVCLPGQSGDLLDSTFLGSITDSMEDLRTVSEGIDDYDITEAQNAIDEVWEPTYDKVKDSYSGVQIDFSDSTNENILEGFSTPTSTYSGCADAQFVADSWIPTIQTPNQISCSLGSANQADEAACTGAGVFAGATGSCNGCMDSQQLLPYLETLTDIPTEMTGRYTNVGDCGVFITQIDAAYNNYYAIKQSTYPSIVGRADTADTDIATYKTELGNLATAFDNAMAALEVSISGVIDPDYGLVAGFNCGIFGDDIALVLSALCSHLFTTTYFLRISLGIAGIGVAFMMCCATCTGVRTYKHELAKSISKDMNNMNEPTKQSLQPANFSYRK